MIHRFTNEYAWLSNMQLVQVKLDGLDFASVEHAYQSAKSNIMEWKQLCRLESNPYEVKVMSKNIRLRDNWHREKIDIMRELIDQKFDQEPFKSQLIETGDQKIVEGNDWGDEFWGVNLDTMSGSNHLGNLIMEKRTKLIENGKSASRKDGGTGTVGS